jgi:D-alanine-D-alanine ligase
MNADRDPAAFGRVAVLMGGCSREREVSLASGATVLAGLKARGVDAHPVDATREALLGLAGAGFQRVFNVLHGPVGEDGVVQGLLDVMGLPYTGSGVLASALGMDKLRSKLIWAGQGIPTPAHRLLDDATNMDEVARELGMPVFVKPAREGSSIAVSKVETADALAPAYRLARESDASVLAEPCIQGPEYTASIVAGRCLPLIGIESEGVFYDYHAKYESEQTAYRCPCGLPEFRETELSEMAMQAFDLIGASGWGRVDFMLDETGRPWFLELNTNPGMTSHSLVPMAARAAGWSFEELVWRILATTLTQETLDGRRGN